MCHVESKPALEQDGAEDSEAVCVAIPDSLLSISSSDRAVEQRADPSLNRLFETVLTGVEGWSAATGYLLKGQLLVRKWVLHRENLVGKPVFQIVIPSKFREKVLRTAHDQSGHLGVRKTYDYML